jgi:hypothetical protein
MHHDDGEWRSSGALSLDPRSGEWSERSVVRYYVAVGSEGGSSGSQQRDEQRTPFHRGLYNRWII